MSKAALIDLIPQSRRQTIFHEEDGRAWIETRQDVDPVVRAASILADQAPASDFRHAAFIPETVLNQAFNEGWFHDPAAWKRWANDPVNDCFRTWKGRL